MGSGCRGHRGKPERRAKWASARGRLDSVGRMTPARRQVATGTLVGPGPRRCADVSPPTPRLPSWPVSSNQPCGRPPRRYRCRSPSRYAPGRRGGPSRGRGGRCGRHARRTGPPTRPIPGPAARQGAVGAAGIVDRDRPWGAALPRRRGVGSTTNGWPDASPDARGRSRGLVEIPFGTAVYEEVLFRGVVLGLAPRRLPPLSRGLCSPPRRCSAWHRALSSIRDRATQPRPPVDQHPAAVTAVTVP